MYLPIASPNNCICWLSVKGKTPSCPLSPPIALPTGTPLPGWLIIPPLASRGNLNVFNLPRFIPGNSLTLFINLFIALIGVFKIVSAAFKTLLIAALKAPPIASPTLVPIVLKKPTIFEIISLKKSTI